MTQAQKYSMKGILRGVEITEGAKKDGSSWKRASLKIEKDGNSSHVATFDENDIDKANTLNGKEVEAIYTKSPDGKYKNLVKGQIKAIGQGEAPVTEEEVVSDETPVQEVIKEESQVKTPDMGTNNFNSAGKDTTPIKENPSDDKMSKADWAEKDKKQYRGMCISYAKDLVVGGKLDLEKMKATAQGMFEFIWEGYDFDAGKKEAEKK